jgi:hypothetical protein
MTTGDSMNGGTTAGSGAALKNGMTGGGAASSSMPSAKNASIQGAHAAGSAEKKGDATSPGGTMKK